MKRDTMGPSRKMTAKEVNGLDKKEIGRRLTEARGNRSQRDVAKEIGISRSALAMYEIGVRVPKDEIKIRIAEFYGLSVQALFFD